MATAAARGTQGRRPSDMGLRKHCETGDRGFELFVGGLPRSATENDMRRLFASHGEILELRMMKDQHGNPKGYCFIRFATKEMAFRAQKEKDGFILQGKKIGVAPSSDQDSLFFGNLNKDWSFEEFDQLVRETFKDVHSVNLAMVLNNEDSSGGKRRRRNKGFAFVHFSSHAAAARAYRVGSDPDFVLGGLHPAISWEERNPEIDVEELAKIKTAFVGNLPTDADEEYLLQLFEPLGKLEKVAISRKGHFPVGFVHFANRLDLENAIRKLDGKVVAGPRRGPSFQIQVAVAKPAEKERKRSHDDFKSKPFENSGVRLHRPKDNGYGSKKTKLNDATIDTMDPYEAAVISLPLSVKDRLLKILRLNVATRYDIGMQCISELLELPESAAVAVLDQFMLSGGDKNDKRGYFNFLVAKHTVDKTRFTNDRLDYPRRSSGFPPRESELSVPHPASTRPPLNNSSRHYSPVPHDVPFSSRDHEKLRERSPIYRPYQSSGYQKETDLPGRRQLQFDPADHLPGRSDARLRSPDAFLRRPEMRYPELDGVRFDSAGRLPDRVGIRFHPADRNPVNANVRFDPTDNLSERRDMMLDPADRLSERPQMKFDPFTGQPYKFDPFTGEPIRPESTSRRSASFF